MRPKKPEIETKEKAVPARKKANWDRIFAALDAASIPDDFMKDRDQGRPQKRKWL